jgi:hypothetical protein
MFRKKKDNKKKEVSLQLLEDTQEIETSPIRSPVVQKEKVGPRLQEEKLRNTLYYLASLIPRETKWKCVFVDSDYHEGDFTKVKKGGDITISATLTKETDQYILLPFGDKPVWCSFPPYVEFTFPGGELEAFHICEKGVHKLIFPEEVKINGVEHQLASLLPLKLKH